MGWNAFLDTVETRAASVTGISYASRAASLDPDKLLKIPRWPAALVISGGGGTDPYSGRIQEGTFSVVIALLKPRGTLGKEASRTLSGLAELMIEEFTHTSEDSSIDCIGISDEIGEAIGQGEVYMIALNFSYDILR